MNNKTLNTLLTVAGAGLGIAAIVLILLSVLSDRNTLIPGLVCVAVGSVCTWIRMLTKKQAQ